MDHPWSTVQVPAAVALIIKFLKFRLKARFVGKMAAFLQ